MEYLSNYIEMMGDTEFAIYMASFVFGLIVLIGLIAKMFEGKVSSAKVPLPPTEPKKKEKPKEKETPPVSPSAPAVPEGMMMWEGDTGKKKKPVPTAPPPPPPKKEEKKEKPASLKAPVPPPSGPVAALLALSPAPLPSDQTRPEDKTVVLPPKSAGPVPKVEPVVLPPAAPTPTGSNGAGNAAPSEEKMAVDLSMYEMLVRRISGVEADVKREPLFLDPLMKRMGNIEKRLEGVSPVGASGTGGGGHEAEVKELKEKILKMQKYLELLSEGPSPDPESKTGSYP
ncbi:MAG: hypothetical protein IPN90_10555 [Elusimicrobia bacterium]|nr:hypothetical protein [Elusimicrobiota bacterium]